MAIRLPSFLRASQAKPPTWNVKLGTLQKIACNHNERS
jgi:hypothetical protein